MCGRPRRGWAAVEDLVGSDVRTGLTEIREFYSALEHLDQTCELSAVRVSDNEAAFEVALTPVED